MTLNKTRIAIYGLVTAPIMVDAIDGLLRLTIGVGGATAIFRLALMAACLATMPLRQLQFTLAFFAYLFSVSVYWAISGGLNNIGFWYGFAAKPFYVILVCLTLVRIMKNGGATHDLYNAVAMALATVAGSFLFSAATGISNKTYGDYAFGEKSFFDGGNDIGLFTLLMSVVMLRALIAERRMRYHAALLLSLVPLALLTTRTSWAGAAIILALYGLIQLLRPARSLGGRLYTLGFFAAILVFIGTVVSEIIALIKENQYLFDKFINTLSEGPRELMTTFAMHRVADFNLAEILFGAGDAVHRALAGYYNRFGVVDYVPLTERFIEQDPLDLYVYGGLIAVMLVYAMHLRLYGMALTLWLRHRCRIEDGLLLLGCSLYIMHSIVAGHAMLSPIVASAIAPLYALAARSQRKAD